MKVRKIRGRIKQETKPAHVTEYDAVEDLWEC